MPQATRSVFVYGTLMPGESRWPALRPFAATWAPAVAPGSLWDTGLGYPGATFSPAGPHDRIPGVVVAVDEDRWDEAVRVLDEIEDEGLLYRRLEVETSAGPATSYEWIGPVARLRPLPDGWVSRRAGR